MKSRTASEPSDSELIAQVRSGSTEAQGNLFERHLAAAKWAAYKVTKNHHQAEDLASDGFEKVIRIIENGRGPESFFRTYLSRTVTNLALAQLAQEKRLTFIDDYSSFDDIDDQADQVLREFDLKAVREAFKSLPKRWMDVLWYAEVEAMKPPEVAAVFGVSPNAASALALRAREGLLQAYLQLHLNYSPTPDCHSDSQKIVTYVRGKLSHANKVKLEAHLAMCPACEKSLLELKECIPGGLGAIA